MCILQERPKLEGWCSDVKGPQLASHIVDLKAACVVEIGVFGGSSLVPMAMALRAMNRGGKIYGIDPWSTEAALEDMKEQASRDWWGKLDLAGVKAKCEASIARLGLTPFVELIQDRNENVLHRFPDESIDLFHLDGNHSEIPAMRDIVNWLPKVKPSGVIVLDDIGWVEAGVETVRRAMEYAMQHGWRLQPKDPNDGWVTLRR